MKNEEIIFKLSNQLKNLFLEANTAINNLSKLGCKIELNITYSKPVGSQEIPIIKSTIYLDLYKNEYV